MPIYDYNGSASSVINKLYDYNGTTSTQIHIVYDYNGTTSSEIYRAEETLFSGLTQETPRAGTQGQTEKKYSSEYTNNGFTSLAVTGTVGATVLDQGTTNFGARTIIQGYKNSAWSDLKSYNCDGNADKSLNAAATVNITGYTKIRVYTYCRRADTAGATIAKAWTNNLKGVAT